MLTLVKRKQIDLVSLTLWERTGPEGTFRGWHLLTSDLGETIAWDIVRHFEEDPDRTSSYRRLWRSGLRQADIINCLLGEAFGDGVRLGRQLGRAGVLQELALAGV